MQTAEILRGRYLPREVSVLFVGESAPAGGTFFYAANSNLYFATRDAFQASLPALEERDFLEEFSRLGCFLEDLCPEPVNHLSTEERRIAQVMGEQRLAERIRALQPKAIVVVMVAIAENVARARRNAGLENVEWYVLPFPGRKAHRDRYVTELASLVRRFEATNIFL